jgi:hypothetical protein
LLREPLDHLAGGGFRDRAGRALKARHRRAGGGAEVAVESSAGGDAVQAGVRREGDRSSLWTVAPSGAMVAPSEKEGV